MKTQEVGPRRSGDRPRVSEHRRSKYHFAGAIASATRKRNPPAGGLSRGFCLSRGELFLPNVVVEGETHSTITVTQKYGRLLAG